MTDQILKMKADSELQSTKFASLSLDKFSPAVQKKINEFDKDGNGMLSETELEEMIDSIQNDRRTV